MTLGPFTGIPIVVDDTAHPAAVEIVDPDTQEVLGGVVLTTDGGAHAVSPEVLSLLRRVPQCLVGGQRPAPWRIETPIYAEVVDVLHRDPLALAGRHWLDPVTAWLVTDTGDSWVQVVAPVR
jgi:hypothetical protein